jgi:hypothetical protein
MALGAYGFSLTEGFPGQVCLVFKCDVVEMTRKSLDLVQ